LTGDPFHSRPAARSFVCRRATGLHANTRFWGGAGRRLQPLSLKRAHGGRGARGGSALPPTAQTPPRPALHIQNMCAPGGGTERSRRGPSKSQVASRPASWPLFYFARCRALPRPRPLLPPPATSSRHLHPLRPPPSPSHPLKRSSNSPQRPPCGRRLPSSRSSPRRPPPARRPCPPSRNRLWPRQWRPRRRPRRSTVRGWRRRGGSRARVCGGGERRPPSLFSLSQPQDALLGRRLRRRRVGQQLGPALGV